MSQKTSEAVQLPATVEREPEYLHDVQEQLAYVQAEWNREAADLNGAARRREHLTVVR
jgi:hypothetical protein